MNERELLLEPNPVEWTNLDYEDTREHRTFTCEEYLNCLNHAALQRWLSFSCSLCPLYRKPEKEDLFTK